MQLTYIKDDNLVIVDGRPIKSEYVAPSVYLGALHAVVWSDNLKEYQSIIDGVFTNTPLEDVQYDSHIKPLHDQWEAQKVIDDTPPPPLTLEEVKALKIQEINDACYSTITDGFWYDGLHYSYDTIDQQNFSDTANIALSLMTTGDTTTSISWNAYSDLEHVHRVEKSFNASEFYQLYSLGALFGHKQINIGKAQTLRTQVEESTTIEQVNAITWE